MSDSDFVDVGDELVVSISGYPVGKARVFRLQGKLYAETETMQWEIPEDIKDYDTVDGYGHHTQPLDGVQ